MDILSRKKQRGAVLVISLIVLVILGVAATTGVGQVTQEYHLATNMDRYNRNFQAADSTLSWCEGYFENLTRAPMSSPLSNNALSDVYESISNNNWWQNDANWANYSATDSSLITQNAGVEIVRCLREEVANTISSLNLPNKMANQNQSALIRRSGIKQYKVTSMAKAINSENKVIVQSDYFIRFE